MDGSLLSSNCKLHITMAFVHMKSINKTVTKVLMWHGLQVLIENNFFDNLWFPWSGLKSISPTAEA
jgi:hypothetical protein